MIIFNTGSRFSRKILPRRITTVGSNAIMLYKQRPVKSRDIKDDNDITFTKTRINKFIKLIRWHVDFKFTSRRFIQYLFQNYS